MIAMMRISFASVSLLPVAAGPLILDTLWVIILLVGMEKNPISFFGSGFGAHGGTFCSAWVRRLLVIFKGRSHHYGVVAMGVLFSSPRFLPSCSKMRLSMFLDLVVHLHTGLKTLQSNMPTALRFSISGEGLGEVAMPPGVVWTVAWASVLNKFPVPALFGFVGVESPIFVKVMSLFETRTKWKESFFKKAQRASLLQVQVLFLIYSDTRFLGRSPR